MYEPRFYRDWVAGAGLVTFEVRELESDLLIRARRVLRRRAAELLGRARRAVEEEIERCSEFSTALAPLPPPPDPQPIIRWMYAAAQAYDVGPMAAVAGAVARFVGEGLLGQSPEVIVENGGDIFLKMERPVLMGLFAGEGSPFTGELCLKLDPAGAPLGVCTSSGSVGHSLSFGRADAVVAVADDAALADAAATAICNRIECPEDVGSAIEAEQRRGLLKGLLIVIGKRLGAYGAIELAGRH